MFQYSSEEIRSLDSDTVITMNWAPFYQEWIIANCGRTLNNEEWDDFVELKNKKREQGLSKAEQFYLESLVNRANEQAECEINKKCKIQYELLKALMLTKADPSLLK